ncbi:MAG: hypothetical protein R3C17_03000 [Planctomycetaceae bacterium]
MAALQPVVLVVDHAVWSLARLISDGLETTTPMRWEGNPLEEEAERIVAALNEWKIAGSPIVVGLSATLCVSMLLKLPTPRHARQRQAMGYLLEPYLPWAAEEMVADYEIRGREAFAVGTSTELLSALLQRLEERGVRVESIVPLARLALQQYMRQASSGSERWALLWWDGITAELWIIDSKRPILWRQIPLEETELLRELKQIALEENQPLPLELKGVADELRSRIELLPDFIVRDPAETPPSTIVESAVREAANILAGRMDSPIEFRRDAWAPESGNRLLQGAVRAVQIAFLCLLIACGVTLYRLGETFDQQRLSAGDRQEDIFRTLFPDVPVPVGIGGRLESEYAKLRGLRGENPDVPEHVPAVQLIERLLRSLPSDLRYRILEVRIEQGRLYLVGHVREHADADRIADELRKIKLAVDPPSTHRLPQQGVEFRISAQLVTEETPQPEGKS